MSFAAAMNAFGLTWNGAVSQGTPDPTGETSGRISLFFKAVRGLEKNRLIQYISEAAKENLRDAILLSFHIRDCRGGKGERELGRQCLQWLRENHTQEYNKVIKVIPNYGRWDDLLNTGELGYQVMAEQLKEDLNNMNEGKSISLCAKWAPTENDSLDKKYDTVTNLCAVLEVTPKQYRKTYISPLREYLKIVENFMCHKQWDKIEYSKVPSQAMRRLKKAFERNDQDRFSEWKCSLEKGEVDVKGKQVSPHELIREIRRTGKADEVCEAQWKVLEEEVAKLGSLQDALFVVDVSGSMSLEDGTPLDVATSLGLLGANAVKGTFHGHVISFATNPSFQIIKDGSLKNRYEQLCKIPWGGSTNIQTTFDLILNRGKACGLTDTDMPKKIFIISDMQFDNASENTNFEVIDRKYKESDFTRPQIVFWNVNGSSTDFPVTVNDQGTALISGFSPAVMKAILKGDNFDPYSILRKTIDDERYNEVREALDA